jgi:DNA modification methylase
MQSSGLSTSEGKDHTQVNAARVHWFAQTPGKCPRCGADKEDLQLGMERTPQEYVTRLVRIMHEVKRVLKKDGTLWLNIGDTYAGGGRGNYGEGINSGEGQYTDGAAFEYPGIKSKDLVGVPWMVAFALRADGWYLRQEIIWHKPAPMPESCTDRCTRSHESLFLLSKSADYYYDYQAIMEESAESSIRRRGLVKTPSPKEQEREQAGMQPGLSGEYGTGRNKRDVWTIPTESLRELHYAAMPQALVEPCILAGSAKGDIVLDPFAGSGTVGIVALRHGRGFRGIDLNPEYANMAKRRVAGPLFAGLMDEPDDEPTETSEER